MAFVMEEADGEEGEYGYSDDGYNEYGEEGEEGEEGADGERANGGGGSPRRRLLAAVAAWVVSSACSSTPTAPWAVTNTVQNRLEEWPAEPRKLSQHARRGESSQRLCFRAWPWRWRRRAALPCASRREGQGPVWQGPGRKRRRRHASASWNAGTWRAWWARRAWPRSPIGKGGGKGGAGAKAPPPKELAPAFLMAVVVLSARPRRRMSTSMVCASSL